MTQRAELTTAILLPLTYDGVEGVIMDRVLDPLLIIHDEDLGLLPVITKALNEHPELVKREALAELREAEFVEREANLVAKIDQLAQMLDTFGEGVKTFNKTGNMNDLLNAYIAWNNEAKISNNEMTVSNNGMTVSNNSAKHQA